MFDQKIDYGLGYVINRCSVPLRPCTANPFMDRQSFFKPVSLLCNTMFGWVFVQISVMANFVTTTEYRFHRFWILLKAPTWNEK